MINLIKNEFAKIFHKKGIYIIMIIMVLYAILTNVIYKQVDFTSHGFESFEIEMYRDNVKNLNPNNVDEIDEYLSSKTNLSTYELYKTYSKDSWQRYVVEKDFYNYFYDIHFYQTGKNKDDKQLETAKDKLNDAKKILDQGDWKKYAEYAKEELQKNDNKNELAKLNLRLKENIRYQNDYLNTALDEYINAKVELDNLKKPDEKSSQEEINNYHMVKENMELNYYIIQNKQDINNPASSHGIIKGLFNEYSFLVLVMIIMIAGSIVSEEFSKGTIKLLLVRPYSRSKILTSKFITALLMIPIAFIVMLFIQIIIGGIFFGFGSLSLPVIVYDFAKGMITKVPLFEYVCLIFLTKMPMYILLSTLAFALSTIFTNTALATVLAIMGNTVSGIINTMLSMLDNHIGNLFVTLNWDFTCFLFGGVSPYEGITFLFSVIVCIIYFIIMIIPTYLIFKNRNIKNI